MQLVTGSTNSPSYYNDFSAENLKVLVGKVGYFKGTYGIPQAPGLVHLGYGMGASRNHAYHLWAA